MTLKRAIFLAIVATCIGAAAFMFWSVSLPFGLTGNRLLHSATSATLYSLEPLATEDDIAREKLHEWMILGSAEVQGDDLELVRQAFLRCKFLPFGNDRKCGFMPRHGLRIVDSDHTYDYLICYDCGLSKLYIDGESAWPGSAGSGSAELNALFKRLGLPVSTTAWKKD